MLLAVYAISIKKPTGKHLGHSKWDYSFPSWLLRFFHAGGRSITINHYYESHYKFVRNKIQPGQDVRILELFERIHTISVPRNQTMLANALLLYESTVQRTSVRCTLMTLQIILKYFGYLENNGHNSPNGAVDSGGGGRRTGNYALIWSGLI